MSRSRLGLVLAAFALVMVPVHVQTANAQTPALACGSWNGFSYTPCTTGLLRVYVQVQNFGSPAHTRQPHDFTVTVNAQGGSPTTFQGSTGGSVVPVAGSYTVSSSVTQGYSSHYSLGCNGTLSNGREASCVITQTALVPYNPLYPYYPYITPTLSCSPSVQTVGLGQAASFFAQGTNAGPYTWYTSDRTYTTQGRSMSTNFTTTGTRSVVVSAGAQTGTCTVHVVAGAIDTAPTTSYTPAPGVSVVAATAPTLPNTGFAPLSSGQVALAIGMIGFLGLLLAPYVRKIVAALG